MLYYMGIDPGSAANSPGALAVIDSTLEIIELFDWSEDGLAGAATRYRRVIKECGRHNIVASLERVHSAPKQGVASTCKFCTNFGQWEGMLAAFNIDYKLIDPRVWQIAVHKHKPVNKKEASMSRARELFPGAEKLLKYNKYHGRADALLLAYYRLLTK